MAAGWKVQTNAQGYGRLPAAAIKYYSNGIFNSVKYVTVILST